MQVIGLTEYGGPDVLHLIELPEAHAGPDQMHASVAVMPERTTFSQAASFLASHRR
jgi:hypothetical protein